MVVARGVGVVAAAAVLVLGCGPGVPADASTTETSGTAETTTAAEPTTAGPASTGSTTAAATADGATTMASTTGDATTGSETAGVTSAGSSEATGPPPCNQIEATLTPTPPNVILVLDKSTYMDHVWDHDGDPNTPTVTRWRSLHEVVEAVAVANDAWVHFGAALYPSVEATDDYSIAACPVNQDVEVPVAAMNAQGVVAGIPAADTTDLHGAVPAAAALDAAFDHLGSLDPAVTRAAIFVTSNAANCKQGAATNVERFEVYDPAVHSVVSGAFMLNGIATYVVGIETQNTLTDGTKDGIPDGVNPFAELNELAVQGGRPRDDPNEQFYEAADQSELQAAFATIVDDARSCVLVLETEPSVPEWLVVEIMGVEVPQVVDCASEDGWVYTHPDGPHDGIELCGAACQELKLAGAADVSLRCTD